MFVVFGAGSLGSLIGGLLSRQHPVTLVGRPAHVEAIQREGLRITGEFDRVVHPNAVCELSRVEGGFVIVTVKSYDTESAAQTLQEFSWDGVLSLQNGMGNEKLLAAHIDAPILAGVTSYGAIHSDPGQVTCTGIGTITIGPYSKNPGIEEDSVASRVHEAFKAADIQVNLSNDMERDLWEKLAVNAGINPITGLIGAKNDSVLLEPARSIANQVVTETAQVAQEEGVELSESGLFEALTRVAEKTRRNKSSMLQDVESVRRTEIDAINGYVVQQSRQDTPINETLTRLVQAWESANNLR